MSELDKLEKYLREHGYEYSREDFEDFDGIISYDSKHQIIVYKDGGRSWDAVCQPGSYGYEEGLLEIMGDIVWYDIDGDSVRGWLTAGDVIARIERGAEGARENDEA